MTRLPPIVSGLLLSGLLWLSRQSALRGSSLGALAVVGAVAWLAFLLLRALRALGSSVLQLREIPVRRDILGLIACNALVAAGLVEESLRLSDPFWWRCALLPGGLALALAFRLHGTRPLHRSPWAGQRSGLTRTSSSWPHISVGPTATHGPAASGAASVSLRF